MPSQESSSPRILIKIVRKRWAPPSGFRQWTTWGSILDFPLSIVGDPIRILISSWIKLRRSWLVERRTFCLWQEGQCSLQASSSTIPAYVMQCNMLPGKVLEGIDRVNRNFLWGSSEDRKKMHWVGWRKVTRPKEHGGLGLQTAKGRNTALLVKLKWRFHSEKNAPWARLLRLKYCNH